jgi:hypothetical protein
MKNRLPVYIDKMDLPVDKYSVNGYKRDKSYGYVNVLYLTSIIITVISVLTVIFLGK